ncbi:MFS transporter [Limobrevibacterium gyesilva]|uniref:MFS transporter n=1 Tax=Limobrevibacterium gyesilva TaxID=2991712 RepID=A0AA41YPD3_9PROT|nr:MFS transporter [Limobrevibacterium gyesilva]MCW3477249.1 MFS transporter [Limobrevibacterium gyesilva]
MNTARQQIVFINAAHSFTHYCLLILPTAVLAMARPGGAFGSEYGSILWLATGGFVLYGLFALPQGWLAGFVGRRHLMTVFFLGTGLSMVSTGFAGTPMMLALALAATGLFAAIYHPIGTALLVEAAGDKPGKAIGLNGVFGNIGVAMAPMITAFVAAEAGWQYAFILPGLACAAVGLLWLRLPAHDGHGHRTARPFPRIPVHLVRRAVIVLLLIAAVSGLVFNAFTLLIPKLMQERLADDPGLLPLAGVAATVATLCGAATQLTVGRLIDRTTLKRIFLPMALVLVPALASLAFVRGWMVLPVAGAVAATIFGQVTVNETMTARYISPELRTKMYSVRFFIGFLGSAAAPPVVGFLHERTGNLSAAVLVLAVFAIVILACAVCFPDRKEELNPELWEQAHPPRAVPAPAE